MSETRTRNEVTGGEKGVKPERFSLIPARPMEEVARVFGHGSKKYADRNWELGYEWSKSMDALERHYNAFKRREDYDEESGLHHLAHTIFHCLALMEWTLTHPEWDDRSGVVHGRTAGVESGPPEGIYHRSNAATPGTRFSLESTE